MSSRHARRISTPLPYLGKLTLSAGVITDDTRLAGVEGDGAAYPGSSVGVWPPATNLFSGKNRSSNSGASLVLTLNSSEYPIFGGVSDKCVSAGSGTGEGVAIDESADVSAATTYTWSVFGVFPAGSTLRLRATERDASDVSIGNVGTVNFVGTGALQRVTFTGATTTGVKTRVVVETITTAQALTWYVAGWQLEAGSIATPFTTASRSAGLITIPNSIIDETQMWVALRAKMGWSQAAESTLTTVSFLWNCRGSANEGLLYYYDRALDSMVLRRDSGGVGTNNAKNATGLWAQGDDTSFCAQITASGLSQSIAGSVFTAATANATIPTLSTPFYIGTDFTAGREPMAAFRWVAIGKGILTDADAALFHAWGNNDPLPHQFPPSAQLSFLAHFNGDGTFYRRSA